MIAADISGSSPADIDPVPAVIDAEAWEELSAGLIQRVRLLDALYADLYGPRTVFETDVAPTSELLADPSYLRPVTGMPRHGAHHLLDRKSTRLNSSHVANSYAVFCLKKKKLITRHEGVST